MEEEYNRMPVGNTFSKASKALGIASLVAFVVAPGILTLILGGLAIILAILSRGKAEIDSKGWAGITMGAVSVGMTIVIVVVTVWLFLCNATFRRIVNYNYKMMYGVNVEDMLQETFGEDFDITKYIKR